MAAGYYTEGAVAAVEGGGVSGVGVIANANSAVNSDAATGVQRDRQTLCEEGHYCVGGLKYLCPAGTFGSAMGLSSAACSGTCLVGYRCPAGSVRADLLPCSSENGESYCAGGVGRTSPVHLAQFSTPLPASEGGKHAEVATRAYPDGGGVRSGQHLCDAGFWCKDAERFPCPAGRYGERSGELDPMCTGRCMAGYYCPARSTRPTQHACGDATVYCASGSSAPAHVSPGYYTVAELDEAGVRAVDGTINTTKRVRTAQLQCDPGWWCADGLRHECPSGRYGAAYGQTSSDCSGPCRAGHWCPARSTRDDVHVCGDTNVYCPEGSSWPIPVDVGYFTVGNATTGPDRRSTETRCPEGHYCTQVDGIKRRCPSGRYGSALGLLTPACSGGCAAGYYCPINSTRPDQVECGGPQLYCPALASLPTPVRVGHYTVRMGRVPRLVTVRATGKVRPFEITAKTVQADGRVVVVRGVGIPRTHDDVGQAFRVLHDDEDPDLRVRTEERLCEPGYVCVQGQRRLCPAGRYGATAGNIDERCTGICRVGYFCPPGSLNDTAYPCGGVAFYCPAGSASPTPVDRGFYTDLTDKQKLGGGGDLLHGGPHTIHKTPSTSIHPLHVDGQPGSTTVGSDSGHFMGAHAITLDPRTTLTHCDITKSLDLWTTANYNGTSPCRRYPVPPEPWQAQGGIEDVPGLSYVYYLPHTLEGFRDVRGRQRPCEEGYFCQGGLRYECPPGRFGADKMEVSPACSGTCLAGHFCPSLSTSPRQNVCGNENLYCPPESPGPTPVTVGFYTMNGPISTDSLYTGHLPPAFVPPNVSDAALQVTQRRCEPGHWCRDGVRYACPAGRYGATTGLYSDLCTGACAAGHYCPAGSTTPYQIMCGGSHLYCPGPRMTPTGASRPTAVTVGHYTVGGGNVNNNTRYDQALCEAGHYCEGGRKMQCPGGRFGASAGLANASCTGHCAAGYFCPPGSVSATAVECGSTRGVRAPCPDPDAATGDIRCEMNHEREIVREFGQGHVTLHHQRKHYHADGHYTGNIKDDFWPHPLDPKQVDNPDTYMNRYDRPAAGTDSYDVDFILETWDDAHDESWNRQYTDGHNHGGASERMGHDLPFSTPTYPGRGEPDPVTGYDDRSQVRSKRASGAREREGVA